MVKKEERPKFEKIRNGSEFKQWYWLKEEMVSICKGHELGTIGGKPELEARIAYYLDTGKRKIVPRKKITSSFDWGKSELTLETVITDSYRNSQNMRNFMKRNAGERFAFSNEFMQ